MAKERSEKSVGGLSSRVYDQIRAEILKGALMPGESVTEMSLAKTCGVSRTPVREALHQLELEGLVELIPNKGAVILGISPEDICDIYEIRAMLEGGAAERAAERATEEDIRRLTEILELTEFYIEKENMPQLQAMDGQFHQLIYEMSGSRMFRRVLKDLHYYVGLTRGASLKTEGRAAQSVKEHKAVLDAIAKHDGKKACELMTRHVNNALKNVLAKHLQNI
ncbi:MAG: GntR family transcriptional regulator [Clostridia bacterium]|nr:GntR family transcriptional regulator [Clostridia bacterium]